MAQKSRGGERPAQGHMLFEQEVLGLPASVLPSKNITSTPKRGQSGQVLK